MGDDAEVVTIGHAIVDVIAEVDEAEVSRRGLEKGTMTLISSEEAERVHDALGAAKEVSGGSAANTAAGLASLGVPVAFLGRVADDRVGEVFVRDMQAAGVLFEATPTPGPAGTGRCVVMVTPDAEKTMLASLGIGELLRRADLDLPLIAAAKVAYLEGYLVSDGPAKDAVELAVEEAGKGRTLVALSLSDPHWVVAQRGPLTSLLDRVNLLFANRDEACIMAGTDSPVDAARLLAEKVPTVVVTLGAEGSLALTSRGMVRVPAEAVPEVVDTTGAGDMFAAGFLAGLVWELPPEGCARLGALAAGEVVTHLGARPEHSLRALAEHAGLLAG